MIGATKHHRYQHIRDDDKGHGRHRTNSSPINPYGVRAIKLPGPSAWIRKSSAVTIQKDLGINSNATTPGSTGHGGEGLFRFQAHVIREKKCDKGQNTGQLKNDFILIEDRVKGFRIMHDPDGSKDVYDEYFRFEMSKYQASTDITMVDPDSSAAAGQGAGNTLSPTLQSPAPLYPPGQIPGLNLLDQPSLLPFPSPWLFQQQQIPGLGYLQQPVVQDDSPYPLLPIQGPVQGYYGSFIQQQQPVMNTPDLASRAFQGSQVPVNPPQDLQSPVLQFTPGTEGGFQDFNAFIDPQLFAGMDLSDQQQFTDAELDIDFDPDKSFFMDADEALDYGHLNGSSDGNGSNMDLS